MESGTEEGLGDALLSAWLDSLLTGLEKFLETSGASAAASGNGTIGSPYRTLLVDNSLRLRRVSLQLAAASCPQDNKRKASHDSSATGTSDYEDARMGVDSLDPMTVSRRSSGRTEARDRHVTRFLEADVLHAQGSPQLWLRTALDTLKNVVRSRKRMLSAVQSVSFFAMTYTLIFTPIIVCFRRVPSPAVSIAEVLCELLLLANVIAPFTCGLPDPDTQEWITSRSAVLMAYARSWLAIDLLAAVPWHILWLIVDEQALLRLSLVRLVLLPKLISQFVFGDFRVLSASWTTRLQPNLLRVVKLISLFFLVVHLIACGYSSVGSSGTSKWASYADEQPSLISQWTSAYYWALCGVLGENMEPLGHAETAYNCTAIVAGVLLNSCIAGSVTAVLGTLDERASRQKSKLDAINTFLNKNGVAHEVCEQVGQYYRYLHESVASHIDSDMFDDLSLSLRLKISLSLHKKFIKRCHLFARCPPDCVVALVSVLSRNWVILVPSELLFKKGAPGDGMYFVSKGEVILYDPGSVRDESSIDLQLLQRLGGQCAEGGAFLVEECKSGSFFGEKALLEERSEREASATAVSFSELLFLPRAEFDNVTARYPGFLHQLRNQHWKRRTSGSSTASFPLADSPGHKAKLAAMLSRRSRGNAEEPIDEVASSAGSGLLQQDGGPLTGMESESPQANMASVGSLPNSPLDKADCSNVENVLSLPNSPLDKLDRLRQLSKESGGADYPPRPCGQPAYLP